MKMEGLIPAIQLVYVFMCGFLFYFIFWWGDLGTNQVWHMSVFCSLQ